MKFQNLPDELWLDIFGMAVEDADFFEPTLPTAFSDSSWFKTLYGDWSLRSAQEVINNAQRRSYATKKVRPVFSEIYPHSNHEFRRLSWPPAEIGEGLDMSSCIHFSSSAVHRTYSGSDT